MIPLSTDPWSEWTRSGDIMEWWTKTVHSLSVHSLLCTLHRAWGNEEIVFWVWNALRRWEYNCISERKAVWIIRVSSLPSVESIDNQSTIPSADPAFQSHLMNAINELKLKSEKKVNTMEKRLSTDPLLVFPVLCTSVWRGCTLVASRGWVPGFYALNHV